jgi:hypothetical protein
MKSKLTVVLAIGIISAVVGVDNAKAQYGCGLGYGYDMGRLYRVLGNNVPHFAAFPPVYYSAPVPRTYGHSPFAYPPGTRTPEIVAAPEPQTLINPHAAEPMVEPTSSSADQVTLRNSASDSSVRPLVVMNPYVNGPATAKQGRILPAVLQAH